MCVDCWNAAMGAPAAAVAARFAWVGYRDRIPFLNRRSDDAPAADDEPEVITSEERVEPDRAEGDLVDAGSSPP